MIKHAVKIVIAVALLGVLSCRKEKDEPKVKPEGRQLIEAAGPVSKDTIAADTLSSSRCSILHSGTFSYKDTDGDDVIVKINGDGSTEEHKDGKYIIVSKIKWLNDCEYENMLVLSTVPNVPLEPGTIMHVAIDKVEDRNIYFTATVKGKSYHNILTKIE